MDCNPQKAFAPGEMSGIATDWRKRRRVRGQKLWSPPMVSPFPPPPPSSTLGYSCWKHTDIGWQWYVTSDGHSISGSGWHGCWGERERITWRWVCSMWHLCRNSCFIGQRNELCTYTLEGPWEASTTGWTTYWQRENIWGYCLGCGFTPCRMRQCRRRSYRSCRTMSLTARTQSHNTSLQGPLWTCVYQRRHFRGQGCLIGGSISRYWTWRGCIWRIGGAEQEESCGEA